MPGILIDGRSIEVPDGATVLQAARRAGIEIPTLCYLEGFEAGASCMVCAVRLKHNGQFIPSCGSRVVDGMEVECGTPEVREARRMALELLFSDHLGDCLSPCQRICPAHLGIPAVLKHVREGDSGLAAGVIRNDLALAGLLCRVCHRPCESGCRRGVRDEPVAIADLVLHAVGTESAASGGEPRLPAPAPERGARVAVVGAGFTGLSAAWFLRGNGYRCTVIEARERPAETIRGAYPGLPPEDIEREVALIERFGVELRTGCRVADEGALDGLTEEFEAVLLAVGPDGPEQAQALGLETAGKKIVAGRESMMTSRPGVFVAGRAVRPAGKPVQSVADGKAAAVCIDQFLSGQPPSRPPKPFSCFIGKIDAGEMDEFMRDADAAERAGEGRAAVDIERAIVETNRCVHCHCALADTCRMRQLAIEYEINPTRFTSGERMRFQRNIEHPLVRFEPGKCIRCGNCIKVAANYREALGLTFIGRGFDVHLGVPFHESMRQGLLKAARAAVAACPTGALTLKEEGSEVRTQESGVRGESRDP